MTQAINPTLNELLDFLHSVADRDRVIAATCTVQGYTDAWCPNYLQKSTDEFHIIELVQRYRLEDLREPARKQLIGGLGVVVETGFECNHTIGEMREDGRRNHVLTFKPVVKFPLVYNEKGMPVYQAVSLGRSLEVELSLPGNVAIPDYKGEAR